MESPANPGEKCEEGASERCYELTMTPILHPPLHSSEWGKVEELEMKCEVEFGNRGRKGVVLMLVFFIFIFISCYPSLA